MLYDCTIMEKKSKNEKKKKKQTNTHRKYFTLECCLMCISPYCIFSFLTFFILNLVAKGIHLFFINNQKFKQSPQKSLIC